MKTNLCESHGCSIRSMSRRVDAPGSLRSSKLELLFRASEMASAFNLLNNFVLLGVSGSGHDREYPTHSEQQQLTGEKKVSASLPI